MKPSKQKREGGRDRETEKHRQTRPWGLYFWEQEPGTEPASERVVEREQEHQDQG